MPCPCFDVHHVISGIPQRHEGYEQAAFGSPTQPDVHLHAVCGIVRGTWHCVGW